MKRALILILFLVGFGVSSAFADIVPIDPPVMIGSWGQTFQITGNLNFNRVEVKMWTPTVQYEQPTLRTFSEPNWGLTVDRDNYAQAQGAKLNTLNFLVAIAQNITQSFSMQISHYEDDRLNESYKCNWDGDFKKWDCNWDYKWDGCDGDKVPEPNEAILLVLALGAVALAFRKLQ